MKELDNLFIEWKQKHAERGYQRFICDGIVDEEWWLKEHKVPKICFFLKEARTQEENYILTDDLRRYEPWKLWQRVAIWTQAIQSAYAQAVPYNHEALKKNSHNAIKQIAVCNVKKSDGTNISNDDDLKKFAIMDKEELKRELILINPDIIVCGYTLGCLEKVLDDELEIDPTWDTMYGFWKDKLVIDYYHPACHYPNRVNYYALMSICKMAEPEWTERKLRYANAVAGDNKAKELAKKMDAACASSTDMEEEELIEYDAEYGYDYHED